MAKKQGNKTVKLHRQKVDKGYGDSARFNSLEEKLKWVLIGKELAWIEEMKRAYDETENPLFVWQAYKIARRNSSIKVTSNGKTERPIQIPHWVLEYFDDTGNVLLDPKNNANADIPALLGFRGRGQGSVFKRWMNHHVRAWAVAMVSEILGREPHRNDAFAVVSEKIKNAMGRTYSERTIKNWYDGEKPD